MVWQPEIDEIEKRVELAKKMGGQEGIEVQHGRGKLTIRERLDLFCDQSSFQEIGRLAGAATYEGCLLYTSPSPRDGLLSRMPSCA